jgi:hypothetical protein
MVWLAETQITILGWNGFDYDKRAIKRMILQITAKVINLFGAPALEVAA